MIKRLPVTTRLPKRFDYKPYREYLKENDDIYVLMCQTWNVSAMQEWVVDALLETVDVPMGWLLNMNDFHRVDEDYAMSQTSEGPLLLAEILPGNYILVDGHHRLHRYMMEGRDTVTIYAIPFLEQLRFIIGKDEARYVFKKGQETLDELRAFALDTLVKEGRIHGGHILPIEEANENGS